MLKICTQDGVKNVKKISVAAEKKITVFLSRYSQSGGSIIRSLNISKRSSITYYSINHFLHKNYYDFYDSRKTVDNFIFSVDNKFVSRGKVSVQGSMELINYQPEEETDQIIELESRRSWLTDVYTCVFFNGYIQEEIRKNFKKRVIINGMTGSS